MLSGFFLCNAANRGSGLELAERLDIAIDVAHAITYLHNYNGRFILSSYPLIFVLIRAPLSKHFLHLLYTVILAYLQLRIMQLSFVQKTGQVNVFVYLAAVIDRSSNYPQRHKGIKRSHNREIPCQSGRFWARSASPRRSGCDPHIYSDQRDCWVLGS